MSQRRQDEPVDGDLGDSHALKTEQNDLSMDALDVPVERDGEASVSARFQTIRDKSSVFSRQLREEIEEYRAHVAESFSQVHRTLIHLDRVLQVESRRREEMRAKLQRELLDSVETVSSTLSQQLEELDRDVLRRCSELETSIASSVQDIEQESEDLEAAVRNYREAASESVSAVARRLTTQRSVRMKCLTDLNVRMQTDIGKTFTLMGENRMAREAALTKFSAQTEVLDKRYQAAAKGGVAALTTQCESLQTGLATERNQRMFRHDELARTLATTFGGAQSDMGLLTQYYTEGGQ